jgi:hypothetical protein
MFYPKKGVKTAFPEEAEKRPFFPDFRMQGHSLTYERCIVTLTNVTLQRSMNNHSLKSLKKQRFCRFLGPGICSAKRRSGTVFWTPILGPPKSAFFGCF